MEGNHNNSDAVRAKIEAIIDARKDEPRKDNNKRLKIILACLSVVVVGLVVAVVLVRLRPWETNEAAVRDVEETTDAIEVCNKITNNYLNRTDYTIDDAVRDFDAVSEKDDDAYKVNLAVCRSKFMYVYAGNSEKALEILRAVEGNASRQQQLKLEYYVTLKWLYEQEGDVEQYNYYTVLVDEISDDGIKMDNMPSNEGAPCDEQTEDGEE